MGVNSSSATAAAATTTTTTMSSPTSPRTHDSTLESEPTRKTKAATEKSSEDYLKVKKYEAIIPEGHEVIEEEEEEAICGFRLLWKDQGFRDIVVEEWENCVEDCIEMQDEEEVVKCFNITTMMKRCMKAHPDYCGPLLQAEKAARREEEARKKSSPPVLPEVSGEKDGGASSFSDQQKSEEKENKYDQ